jgi:hypothetical protein
LLAESEAEMEGVQCDFCHRIQDNAKRASRHSGALLPAGNGGFFVKRTTSVKPDNRTEPTSRFANQAEMCGTCHDVTNPLLKTRTAVNGSVPDMLHPIERTYTEWYWSAYRAEGVACQNCHKPMTFQGAQTWMLYPGLDALWGNVDQKWLARGYPVAPAPTADLQAARARNVSFMAKKAAQVTLPNAPVAARPGDTVGFDVKVTNLSGHKLPTGYAEGRQMWLHVWAVDESGRKIYEDGALDGLGQLVTTAATKVYRQTSRAASFSFLDEDGNGTVDLHEGEFHFVGLDTIESDNRIPPRGYNKPAYQADGAFIIPENLYQPGQNWDVTRYTFTLPAGTRGNVTFFAELLYQTYNREYMEFLRDHDTEKTARFGGRMRDLPAGPFGDNQTWGQTTFEIWEDAGMGPPVKMGTARARFDVR